MEDRKGRARARARCGSPLEIIIDQYGEKSYTPAKLTVKP